MLQALGRGFFFLLEGSTLSMGREIVGRDLCLDEMTEMRMGLITAVVVGVCGFWYCCWFVLFMLFKLPMYCLGLTLPYLALSSSFAEALPFFSLSFLNLFFCLFLHSSLAWALFILGFAPNGEDDEDDGWDDGWVSMGKRLAR